MTTVLKEEAYGKTSAQLMEESSSQDLPFQTAERRCILRPPTVPAGVSWATSPKTFAASLLTRCARAEAVHGYYRQDLTIPEIPPKPGELKRELWGLKKRQHEPQISQQ
ncbi:protein BRAWNIN-like [Neomonachus schauinslandi]|uniref:Protein BRAWNIN-like n=1 Tax=Neomonachus schauinslandi TaxID=29088 RepID=A0A8M1MDJ8_NEOSC|nr:protein BRAWNIN-like [Neomonachus schauinslandi]